MARRRPSGAGNRSFPCHPWREKHTEGLSAATRSTEGAVMIRSALVAGMVILLLGTATSAMADEWQMKQRDMWNTGRAETPCVLDRCTKN